jgi:hypothetical protein
MVWKILEKSLNFLLTCGNEPHGKANPGGHMLIPAFMEKGTFSLKNMEKFLYKY